MPVAVRVPFLHISQELDVEADGIFFTAKRDPKELVGLVFGLTPKPKAEARWYARPAVWGTLAVIVAIVLNVIFW